SRGGGGRADRDRGRRHGALGRGARGRSAARGRARVGVALVRGSAVPVGRAHRVGDRLLGVRAGELRRPRRGAAAGRRPTGARGSRRADVGRGGGVRGGGPAVFRGRAAGFARRPVGGGGARRARGARLRGRRIGGSVHGRPADGVAAGAAGDGAENQGVVIVRAGISSRTGRSRRA